MDATVGQAGTLHPVDTRGVLSGRVSRHAALAELGQAALLNQDVDVVLRMAVDVLCEVLGVEYAKVLHQPAPEEPLVLKAGRGWQHHIRVGETTVPCARGSQAGFTLLSNEPIFVDDLASERRFAGPPLLTEHGVVSGMSVVIPGPVTPYGVLGIHTVHQRHFTNEEGDFLRSVANILGGTVEKGRYVEQIERRARYETALAKCAQALLASSGDDRMEEALLALLDATHATYVFVERNVFDPDLGLCSETIAEVEQPGADSYVMNNEYWSLVPWDKMPISRLHLENGEPFVLIPSQLRGVEFELYAADPFPVKCELDIPIFTNGEWAGLIGFADKTVERSWSDADLSLLNTAAKMIGAFWEREAARNQLRELSEAKDQFLASVSHELRTPLTAVVGFGQVLRDAAHTMSAQERSELLEMVVAQGTDLTNIVNDLLAAAKADIGTLEVTLVPVDLRAQTAQVLETFERSQVAGIELAGQSVRAVGDPDRVRQIVRNLITNAIRYGGDTIRVELSVEGAFVSVLVRDDGDPIPEDDQERIFEPYQRAHSSPGLAGSLGLGLAISRRLARLMDGDLGYRHEDGESIFELALPKAN